MAKWEIKNPGDYQRAAGRINEKLDDLRRALKQVPAQTIHECLTDTLEKSVARTPVDEGPLRESGHVAVDGVRTVRGRADGSIHVQQNYVPNEEAAEVTFEIGYTVEGGGSGREGDVNTYAWVQHEHVEFNHPNGGEAKFLETAINEDKPTWGPRIKTAVREQLKGG